MAYDPLMERQKAPNHLPSATTRVSWQDLARLALLLIALLALGLLVWQIPYYYQYILTDCIDQFCDLGLTPPPGADDLLQAGLTPGMFAGYATVLSVIVPLAYFLIALLIFWQKPNERMALFGAYMLMAWGITMSHLGIFGKIHPGWAPVFDFMSVPGLLFLTLFFFLFPDGRFSSRPAAWLAASFMLVLLTGHMFRGTVLDYLFYPPLIGFLFFLAWIGSMVGVQISRYRRNEDVIQQQQTKWVIFGFSATLSGLLGFLIVPAIVSPSLHIVPNLANSLIVNTGLNISLLFIPFSFGVAILRYHLWDIDLWINRTLVFSTLTAGIVGLYALIVGGLGALFQTRENLLISLLTTGLIAVLFAPLHERLQRGVNRLMYGKRNDPYAVLSHLGSQLETSMALETVLPNLIETIKDAFKIPYVAIELRIEKPGLVEDEVFENAASSGSLSAPYRMKDLQKLSLTYQGELLGRLILAPRAPGENFSPVDWRLLTDLARQAGAALHAVQLTAALQRSREKLVLAREEERRRLRNDLHDGIGPQLAGLILKIDTVRNRLAHDPLAAEMLSDLATRTREIVSDVRGVVYDLRPPILDGMGLVAAIQEMAASYTENAPNVLDIQLNIPDSLPALPAAVEVALYRISQEALANVVQHSGARKCMVRLKMNEAGSQIFLEICDDGKGLAPEQRKNVGLYSMVERAVEIGGTCTIDSETAGGVAVRVQLPI